MFIESQFFLRSFRVNQIFNNVFAYRITQKQCLYALKKFLHIRIRGEYGAGFFSQKYICLARKRVLFLHKDGNARKSSRKKRRTTCKPAGSYGKIWFEIFNDLPRLYQT